MPLQAADLDMTNMLFSGKATTNSSSENAELQYINATIEKDINFFIVWVLTLASQENKSRAIRRF
ncbi:hypothetical protein GL2_26030 [Microbulbifer sp. GL-2]|nr:hypothetical protein GL2_26030 [Microbulbifer sp. GL-2]